MVCQAAEILASNLSEADGKYCYGDENAPDHDSLIELLGPVSALSFPQTVMSLVINHCVQVLVDLLGGGLHL